MPRLILVLYESHDYLAIRQLKCCEKQNKLKRDRKYKIVNMNDIDQDIR